MVAHHMTQTSSSYNYPRVSHFVLYLVSDCRPDEVMIHHWRKRAYYRNDHRAIWQIFAAMASLPQFQIFAPFLFQFIVCVCDSGRRQVLVAGLQINDNILLTVSAAKRFRKKQNNGGAPGANLSSIFRVFVKNLGIIWPKWEREKVDTTRLTPGCEPCQK